METQPQMVSLGDHELIRMISSGSYGEVWLARSELGAYRALKIVRQARFDSPRPFKREYEGIKKFEPISRSHEGFVDVLHVGRGPEANSFYYVMELADDLMTGTEIDPATYRPRTLASEIEQRGPLAPDECIQLGIQLCRTLAFLHDRGLIHRDVKPSNVIFIANEPKLADIGLIADVQNANTFVGTEGFIPPEGPNSTQADIYSLGKLLYEISTGKDRTDFPALPDRAVFSEHFLELNAVLVKACHTNVNQRYPDALAMASDLELIATGKSVRRLHYLESQFKSLRKAAFVTLVTLAALAFVYHQVNQHFAREREARATLIGSRVGQGTALLNDGDLLAALPPLVEALELDDRGLRPEATHRLRIGSLLAATPKIARVVRLPDRPIRTCSLYGHLAAVNLERQYSLVIDLSTGKAVSERLGAEYQPQAAVFMPAGETLLSANWDNTARIIDWRTGRTLEKFEHPRAVLVVHATQDERWILTGCRDGSIYLWDRQDGSSRLLGKHDDFVLSVRFGPSGKIAITTATDSTARVWDLSTGSERHRFVHGIWVYNADFNPEESMAATAGHDGEVKLWDLRSGDEIGPSLQHGSGVRSVRFSGDGSLILAACLDGTAKLWEAKTHRRLSFNHVLKHKTKLFDGCFSSDGKQILTAGSDGSLTLWDFRGLPPKPQFLRKTAPTVKPRTFTSPDGNWVAQLQPGRVLLGRRGASTRTHIVVTNNQTLVQFDRQSRRLVASDGARVHLADLQLGVVRVLNHPKPVTYVQFSPDGTKLVCASADKSLDELSAQVWDTATAETIGEPLAHDDGVLWAAFSPDSQRVVTASEDFSAVIWDANSGERIGLPMLHREKVYQVTFAETQPWVATASEDFTAMIWDASTGDSLTPPFKHARPVREVRFAENDTALITTDEDGNQWRWKLTVERRPAKELAEVVRPLAGLRDAPGK